MQLHVKLSLFLHTLTHIVSSAGVCLRAGAATAKWTARTEQTSSTAPSSFHARSSPRQQWVAWSVDFCWSSPWAAPVNCTLSAPGNTGERSVLLISVVNEGLFISALVRSYQFSCDYITSLRWWVTSLFSLIITSAVASTTRQRVTNA